VALVGLTQEQHPERCQLFAQWQQLDWPILWDPFNLSGSNVVPAHVLVDELGIVRAVDPRPAELAAFLAAPRATGAAPPSAEPARAQPPRALIELDDPTLGPEQRAHFAALSDLLWRTPGRMDAALETLEQHAARHAQDPRSVFRAGVARRMRYDSPSAREGDFQRALEHWARALASDPNQYIWRRRIQQYGPRMDKPYPFYDWVATARAAITARGETPTPLGAELTPTELAERAKFAADSSGQAPDPDGRIARDEHDWLAIETVVAFEASKGEFATVHLALRPTAGRALWSNESGPTLVWLAPGPEFTLERSALAFDDLPPRAESDETRRMSVDVQLAADATTAVLRGYALAYLCGEEHGACRYLRRDFAIELRRR